jgi:hypothetical protein
MRECDTTIPVYYLGYLVEAAYQVTLSACMHHITTAIEQIFMKFKIFWKITIWMTFLGTRDPRLFDPRPLLFIYSFVYIPLWILSAYISSIFKLGHRRSSLPCMHFVSLTASWSVIDERNLYFLYFLFTTLNVLIFAQYISLLFSNYSHIQHIYIYIYLTQYVGCDCNYWTRVKCTVLVHTNGDVKY